MGSNPFRVHVTREPENFASEAVSGSQAPTTSALDAIARGTAAGSNVRQLASSRSDIAAVLAAVRAIGNLSDRHWKVGTLVGTLASWFLTGGDEERRIAGECDTNAL